MNVQQLGPNNGGCVQRLVFLPEVSASYNLVQHLHSSTGCCCRRIHNFISMFEQLIVVQPQHKLVSLAGEGGSGDTGRCVRRADPDDCVVAGHRDPGHGGVQRHAAELLAPVRHRQLVLAAHTAGFGG